MPEPNENERFPLFKRLCRGYTSWVVLAGGFLLGIIFWGGFNTFMEYTNTMAFCTGCHEMRDTVFQEYKQTVHYQNASGVRASCADCHVPKEWGPKLVRKIRASNELFHKILGTIDTPEKFEAKRLELAEHVWASMRATNSRECRNCHDLNAMALVDQKKRAQTFHREAKEEGKTCIECHEGIAHKLPAKPAQQEETDFAL